MTCFGQQTRFGQQTWLSLVEYVSADLPDLAQQQMEMLRGNLMVHEHDAQRRHVVDIDLRNEEMALGADPVPDLDLKLAKPGLRQCSGAMPKAEDVGFRPVQ